MFEEAINELEAMGIPYQENEDGTLAIDISGADKTDVVTIVSFLNDRGISYSIDAETINVSAPAAPVEAASAEGEAAPEDAMAAAMSQMYE